MWATIATIVGYALADRLKEAVMQNKPEQISSIITQMSSKAISMGEAELARLQSLLNGINMNQVSGPVLRAIQKETAKMREQIKSLESDLNNARSAVEVSQSYASQAYGDNSVIGSKRRKLANKAVQQTGAAVQKLQNDLEQLKTNNKEG